MRKFLLFLFALAPLCVSAQYQLHPDEYYLTDSAVTTVDGYVQFDRSYTVKGKTRAEIMELLKDYIQQNLVDGEEQLPQSRITEYTPETGVVAASIEEYMYFKRTNWQIHRVRFYYQLVFTVDDGKYAVSMRRLHYIYDPEVTAGDFADDRRAENWITNNAAVTTNKKGVKKLARLSGKFRVKTIDRKDDIFKAAALATGALVKRKVQRMVDEEEVVAE